MWVLDLNLGPLQEQLEFSTAKPSPISQPFPSNAEQQTQRGADPDPDTPEHLGYTQPLEGTTWAIVGKE